MDNAYRTTTPKNYQMQMLRSSLPRRNRAPCRNIGENSEKYNPENHSKKCFVNYIFTQKQCRLPVSTTCVETKEDYALGHFLFLHFSFVLRGEALKEAQREKRKEKFKCPTYLFRVTE